MDTAVRHAITIKRTRGETGKRGGRTEGRGARSEERRARSGEGEARREEGGGSREEGGRRARGPEGMRAKGRMGASPRCAEL
eukprot:6776167-Alexandrium_andersonii.AAC.2